MNLPKSQIAVQGLSGCFKFEGEDLSKPNQPTTAASATSEICRSSGSTSK